MVFEQEFNRPQEQRGTRVARSDHLILANLCWVRLVLALVSCIFYRGLPNVLAKLRLPNCLQRAPAPK